MRRPISDGTVEGRIRRGGVGPNLVLKCSVVGQVIAFEKFAVLCGNNVPPKIGARCSRRLHVQFEVIRGHEPIRQRIKHLLDSGGAGEMQAETIFATIRLQIEPEIPVFVAVRFDQIQS